MTWARHFSPPILPTRSPRTPSDQIFVTLGGRCGFESLDQSAFIAANLTAAQFDYDSTRQIGGGLGTAKGSTDGSNLFGASVKLGYDHGTPDYRVTPTAGLRASHLQRDAFAETGSEMALAVEKLSEDRTDLLLGVEVEATPAQFGNWSVAPALSVAYEHALDGGDTESSGFIEELSLDQVSDFDDKDVIRLGLRSMPSWSSSQSRPRAVIRERMPVA
ncbi:autotransporter outer membrane beta-barrel domain-containing protein [Paracoccus ravus]|uniref:autotransporter outer membrane beta-barrel domain-containing protein n=1 Tax=Paracoccus ravus TaxID=2447760 RepID=UPI00106E4EAF|nr:autotransporter outer membrane beta-barrel domain-containing protein [Paracoccus ravus]